jgi:DNA-binding XRE family transcriptional regulator
MDAAVWRELARLVYQRRIELGLLSQQALADAADVHVNTIGRLERGEPSTRRNPSWAAIEAALGWPQGWIYDFIEGRTTKSAAAVTEDVVRQAVLDALQESAPDVTIRQANLVARGVVARLGRRGLPAGGKAARG